ncbi:ornithine cyclodeaminase family protein [Knoellia sp. 3-2P3]|uniref:ornithine cyclodeaminase family protein n=1 Tax=unclassified Knoellia TaxID=2618719 RepID=UPI0023DC8D12|nr:ornithine cyclodeaminase family protein [Knoellia sp. 3-2P3]MDF2092763.1 ornithine cyclodeaminase family protein [Knoellia sp. 3-2P3]
MLVLTDDDVRRLLPPPAECVELAAAALTALADGRAEAPPKPAVHTLPGSFANAMPAAWPERGLLGCKWISIFPDNPARGLPTASGVMVVNDGETGLPVCLMPAAELTAARTAAVSGACVRHLAPPRPGHVAITGAGVQARSHLRVLEALGWHDVVVWARRTEALDALTAWAAEETPSVRLRRAPEPAGAVRGAAVVVTALSIGLTGAELHPEWVRDDALLLPLDYASSVGPALAATALLAADDVVQFEAVRSQRKLGDYPSPTTWTGALLAANPRDRPTGRVVCQNLGNGLSDLVVADAVWRAAGDAGAGQVVGGTST